jgi:hypothetical protein
MFQMYRGIRYHLLDWIRSASTLRSTVLRRIFLLGVIPAGILTLWILLLNFFVGLLSLPVVWAKSPTASYTILARYSPEKGFLDSYSQHLKYYRSSVASTALIIALIAVRIIAFFSVSYFTVGNPQPVQAVGENLIGFWDGGAAPTGWSCQSCGSGDFYQKFIRGASAYGATGGSATNTHTVAWVSSANASGVTSVNSGGTTYTTTTHRHNSISSGSTVAGTSLPVYQNIKVIRYDTDGTPGTLPAGFIGMFDTTPPAGWTTLSAYNSDFLYGENDASGVGGAASHTHSTSITTGTQSATTTGSSDLGGTGTIALAHTHTGSATSGSGTHTPLYRDVILAKADADTTVPSGMLAIWDATPPAPWSVVSGTSAAFDARFLRGAASYGGTGGAATHSHSNLAIPVSTISATENADSVGGGFVSSGSHTQNITVSLAATNNLPPYLDVIIARYNVVTVSGTVRQTDESTTYDCSANNLTINVSVNGGTNTSTTCTSADGSYSVAAPAPGTAGDPVVVSIDSAESVKGTTVTLAADTTSNISNLDLYQDRLVVSHENAGPVTNAKLATGDNADAGIRYSVSASNLTVESGIELHVKSSKTFTPGGTVTTNSTGGNFHIDDNAVATLDTATNTIGVDISVDTGATLNINATTTVTGGDITTAGTGIVATTSGTPTTTLNASGAIGGGSGAVTFYALRVSGGTTTVNSDTTINNTLTVDSTRDLSIASAKTVTTGSAATVSLSGTISGAGRLTYQNSGSTFPTTGTISSILRFDTVNGNMNLPERSYEGAVEVYNNTSNSRTVTPTGNFPVFYSHLYLTADGTGDITFAANTNNPFPDILGDLDFTGVGAGTERLFTGSQSWNVGGNVDFTDGVVTSATGNALVMYGGNKSLIGAGQTLYSLQIANSSTTTTITGSDLTISYGLYVSSTDTLSIASGRTVTMTGAELSSMNGVISGAGTFTYTNSAAFTTTGTINTTVRFDATNNDQTMSARTYGGLVEIYSNSSSNARTVTMASGTHTLSSNLNLIADNSQNVSLAGGTNNPTVTIAGNVDFTGVGAGTEVITSGTGTWTVSGNVDFTGGTYTTANGNTLAMNGSSKTLTTASNSLYNFTLSGGSTSMADATTVSNNLTISSGTLTAPSTLSVGGNFSNSGTFTHNSGTVTLNGSSQQTLSGTLTGSSAFNNLTVTNASGTNPDTSPSVIFSSAAQTAGTFSAITASTKIRFAAAATYTFQNIVFNGQATGTRVALRSSTGGSAWNLNVAGTRSVSYTDVKDSYACGQAPDIDASSNTNLNSTGNSCWTFADVDAPTFSNISTTVTNSTIAITWDTNEAATTKVKYGLTAGYGTETTEDPTLTTSHSVTLTGLASGTTYHFQVLGSDAEGNAGSSADQTATTSSPTSTVITNTQSTVLSTTSVRITWTTNHAADSKVRYGTTTAYGLEVYDATLVTSHSITLTGLTAGTTYHYEVLSVGNTSTNDADATFTTPSGSGPAAPTNVVINGEEADVNASISVNKRQGITVEGSATANAAITVLVTDTDVSASTTSSNTGQWSTLIRLPALPLDFGTYELSVKVTKNGASSTTVIGNFTLASPEYLAAPTITAPAADEKVIETQPVVRGLARSNNIIRVFIDGQLDGRTYSTEGTNDTGTFFYRLKTVLSPGPHEIMVVAINGDGIASANSLTRTFSVVRPFVTPTLLTPIVSNGNDPAITLRGNAWDDSNIHIELDGEDVDQFTVDASPEQTAAFAHTFSLKDVSDGVHSIVLVAYDRNGKAANPTRAITFTKQASQVVAEDSFSFEDEVTYTVQAGDSLWSIAERFYGNGGLYTMIASANSDTFPSLATSPSVIQVGWTLRLPPR